MGVAKGPSPGGVVVWLAMQGHLLWPSVTVSMHKTITHGRGSIQVFLGIFAMALPAARGFSVWIASIMFRLSSDGTANGLVQLGRSSPFR